MSTSRKIAESPKINTLKNILLVLVLLIVFGFTNNTSAQTGDAWLHLVADGVCNNQGMGQLWVLDNQTNRTLHVQLNHWWWANGQQQFQVWSLTLSPQEEKTLGCSQNGGVNAGPQNYSIKQTK